MDYSDHQFYMIILSGQFRNESFKSNPSNLQRVIEYIETMLIDTQAIQTIEQLIMGFGVPILYCFEPFYKRLRKNKNWLQKKGLIGMLRSIVGMVKLITFSSELHELEFFAFAGEQNVFEKEFEVRQKGAQEIQFMKDLETVRSCIKEKRERPDLKVLPKTTILQLTQINSRMSQYQANPFMCYYMKKMLENLKNQFHINDIKEMNKYLNFSFQTQVQISIKPNKDPNIEKQKWDGKILCPPLFKARSFPAVYILLDSHKCHVPNPQCYSRIFKNGDIVTKLDIEEVKKIPTGPALDSNAILVRAEGQPAIYLLNHKVKRLIPNNMRLDYFGFCQKKVQVTNQIMINNYETGPQI